MDLDKVPSKSERSDLRAYYVGAGTPCFETAIRLLDAIDQQEAALTEAMQVLFVTIGAVPRIGLDRHDWLCRDDPRFRMVVAYLLPCGHVERHPEHDDWYRLIEKAK